MVKYKFVLPSVKSSVVALVAMVPEVAFKIPVNVPNVKPANVGLAAVVMA